MSNEWQVEDILVGTDNLLWFTIKNAPEVLLASGTLHLRTYHEIDESKSIEQNLADAILEVKRRVFFLEEKLRERHK